MLQGGGGQKSAKKVLFEHLETTFDSQKILICNRGRPKMTSHLCFVFFRKARLPSPSSPFARPSSFRPPQVSGNGKRRIKYGLLIYGLTLHEILLKTVMFLGTTEV